MKQRPERGEGVGLASEVSPAQAKEWLLENGPRELELLFRAIVYHPSVPILIADDERNYQDASLGAGKLLGLSRDMIIGRKLDDFADAGFKPQISEMWRNFLGHGEQAGTLRLAGPDGTQWDVAYTAKGNVLPVRHLLVLHNKGSEEQPPSWVQDYALFLLDAGGRIASWYSGAARIYGYAADEIVGWHVSRLYPDGETAAIDPREELSRAAAEGHFGYEGWHARLDGSRFWANTITVALRDPAGELQGFARAVRDFSERHERDEKLRRNRARVCPVPSQSTIAGIVSGEFDRVPEANEAFLKMVGYSREDLLQGRLVWPDLTPPEYAALDDLAHEEGLRFGACTPYEKELLRKDGTRIPVLVATAVLKLSPFRWISFVQDLRDRDQLESVGQEDVEGKQNFEEMVGNSATLRRILRQVEVVAPTDANVLILGETGTGKELVARAIHRLSPRRKLPFITLNCAAIPTGLLESELFGYEKGAFTGALSQKMGRFELAHRGTLFLDEVGDIPLDLQPKLLRALQEKSFERLGGTRTIPIDVRLVAATNRNLTQMMGDKLFRSDLYYRLKVFPITTAPLRDHPEDIPLLARHFTQKYARKMGKEIDKIPSETMKALEAWPWPGNVRELENFIERAVILSRGPNLRAPLSEIRAEAFEAAGESTLEQVEREHVVKILRETGGVISKAAMRLGIPRTTLNALMKKLGIARKDL
ncbi:MAG: sigma-54 dependent transcriptional regulator, Fis family [Candidatus Solibacter sp.]|nr:sigma-54 dependent transcriptional regulator, Fis family [Candidatus Solibacter sp.]